MILLRHSWISASPMPSIWWGARSMDGLWTAKASAMSGVPGLLVCHKTSPTSSGGVASSFRGKRIKAHKIRP